MVYRFAASLFAALLALCALGAGAGAQADPFTVTNIHIDESADNATEAQRRALESGQIRAARILIERLTLAEDRVAALPDAGDIAASQGLQLDDPVRVDPPAPAAAQMPDRLPPITAGQAASLIAGFDISNERRSPTRYIGDLSVTFDRRAVRDYLAGYNIPFVQSQARPILVVPVLQSETGSVVWAGPWYEAWRSERFAHSLVPFIGLGSRFEESGEAAGSAADAGAGDYVPPTARTEPVPATPLGRRLLSTSDAQSLNEGVLRELAELYGADRVAVIAARSSGGLTRAGGTLLEFNDGEVEREAIPTIAIEGGFETAATRIVDMTEEAWKRRSIVREGGQNTLEVTVLYRGIRDWHGLQNAVAGASLVSNARLDALSRTGAMMTLSYRGDMAQLRSELRSRGAYLEETADLGWTVRSTR